VRYPTEKSTREWNVILGCKMRGLGDRCGEGGISGRLNHGKISRKADEMRRGLKSKLGI
jgi:hypothetical protein